MNSALGIVIGLAVLSCIFWILGAGVCHLMGRKEEPGFLWLFGMALFLGIFSVVDIFTEAGVRKADAGDFFLYTEAFAKDYVLSVCTGHPITGCPVENVDLRKLFDGIS